MKSFLTTLLPFWLCIGLLLPVSIQASNLPLRQLRACVQDISGEDSLNSALPVATPLSIQTVLDSSRLYEGRILFFRVSEDVFLGDKLLFGAGAIARGYIKSLKNEAGMSGPTLEIVPTFVQATDGAQQPLLPNLMYIQTSRIEAKLRIEATCTAQVTVADQI